MIVDGVKYSCLPCVKGHRSANCPHGDRPLVEVKKKGRPPTQCQHCRELRKERKIHLKCCCTDRPEGGNAPRTLPEGLKSLQSQSSATTAQSSINATPSPPTSQRDPSPIRPLLAGQLSASSVSSALSSASEPSHSADSALAGRRHTHAGFHKDIQAAHKPHALAHGAHASGHHTPAVFSPYPHLLPHHAHSNLGTTRSEGSRSVDDLGSYLQASLAASSGAPAASNQHPLAGLGYGPKYALPPLLTRSPSNASLSSNASQQPPHSAGPLSASGAHPPRPHPHSHLSDVSYPWPEGSPAVPAPTTPSLPVPPETPAMSEEQFLKAFQAALATGPSAAPAPATIATSAGTPDLTLGQNGLDGGMGGGQAAAGVDEFTFGTAQAPSYLSTTAVATSAFDALGSMYAPTYSPGVPGSAAGGLNGAGYVPAPAAAPFDLASWARSTSGYAASTSTTGTDHPPPARSDFSIPPTSNAWSPSQQQQQQQPPFPSTFDGQLGQLSLGTGGGGAGEFDELSVERWRSHAAYLDAQGGTEQGGFGAPLQQISSISSVASWTSASNVPSSAAAMNQLNLANQAAQGGVKQEELWDDGPGLSPTFDKEFELDPQYALNHPSHPHHQLSPDQWLPLDDEDEAAGKPAVPALGGASDPVSRAVSAQSLYSDPGPTAAFGTMRQPTSFEAFFNTTASSTAGSEASFSQSRPQSVVDWGQQGEAPIPFDLNGFPELGLGEEAGKGYEGGAGATPRWEPDFEEQERRRREGTVTEAVPGWAVKEEEEDRRPDIGRG